MKSLGRRKPGPPSPGLSIVAPAPISTVVAISSVTNPASSMTFPPRTAPLLSPSITLWRAVRHENSGAKSRIVNTPEKIGPSPFVRAQDFRPALGQSIGPRPVTVGGTDPSDCRNGRERGVCGHGHPEGAPLDRL